MSDHKIGRNDPCPCGSGKKYKRCHGANDSSGDAAVRAALRIHRTPDGKAVPTLGLAPLDDDAWDTFREQLQRGEDVGLLDPMDNPDHWEAVGLELWLTQTGPGVPRWTLRTAPRRRDENGEPRPIPDLSMPSGKPSLWNHEWQLSLPLADVVDWVDALHGWKSVVIAPFDATTSEFLPFGFQIWVPAHQVIIEPWRS